MTPIPSDASAMSVIAVVVLVVRLPVEPSMM